MIQSSRLVASLSRPGGNLTGVSSILLPLIPKQIHLATALLNNVDELHTFDRDHLVALTDQIERKDGAKLKICHPPKRPAPQPPPMPLFDRLEPKSDEKKSSQGGNG